MRTVLLVEDNAVTRKLFRVALQGAGWSVLEAEDGGGALALAAAHQPALVLQDLRLPDMSGFELAHRLRELPHGPAITIIAVSGLLSSREEIEFASSPFTDFVAKPVEPSRLLALLEGYAPREAPASPAARGGQRILICDDNPDQLKILAYRIRELGYVVETASDGKDGLEKARRTRPAAIVSDILMPELDGFGLCLAIRLDPHTADVPIVLASSAYIEAADRDLAAKVGASACVIRTPDLRELLDALAASIGTDTLSEPAMPVPIDEVAADHLSRVVRQTERQAAVNSQLARRATLLAAELAALESISEVLGRTGSAGPNLSDILGHCLEAGGVSEGVLYLGERSGLPPHPAALIGFAGASDHDIAGFFSHPELLDSVLTGSASFAIPSDPIGPDLSREILGRAGVVGMVAVPIAAQGETMGALVMGARTPGRDREDWLAFARTASLQVGQALVLARTLRQNRLLLDSVSEGIWGIDSAGIITFVNRAGADLLGELPAKVVGRPLHPVIHSRCADPDCDLARALDDDRKAGETAFHLASGGSIMVEYTAALVREGSRSEGKVLLIRDVTERDTVRKLAALEELRRQQLHLKDQFFTQVSHELRTPLAAIHQFVSILLDGLAGPIEGEQRQYLEIVSRNIEQLRSMISDLLESGRVEGGRAVLSRESVSIAELIGHARDTLSLSAENKGIRLSIDVGAAPLAVYADVSRVGQVLTNLIDNALKFTPAGGHVCVSARAGDTGDGSVRVSVADNGAGIPSEELPHVFEYLFQGANNAAQSRKGFGIGLHVCKELVERHGGRLWVESRPGEGATFSFTLPAVSAEIP